MRYEIIGDMSHETGKYLQEKRINTEPCKHSKITKQKKRAENCKGVKKEKQKKYNQTCQNLLITKINLYSRLNVYTW